ncbi:MAG TPA: sigma 54-interacting transcriptional regulator [Thermoanaerobaculia bacterium]|nr:sigma 54-interacting transcriptional regulator [Thermoanaerobaculia bacterium]
MSERVVSPVRPGRGSQRTAAKAGRGERADGDPGAKGAASDERSLEPALAHGCLGTAEASSVPVASYEGTDRQRVGLLLQACCLLSHLQRAGWRPLRELSSASVDTTGRLRVGDIGPGPLTAAPQQSLRRLLRALFRGVGIAGRGQGRRAARSLLEHWRQDLVAASPDAEVARILDEAPFLWEGAYSVHREALVGEHSDGWWVAGPGAFRRRTLAAGDPAKVRASVCGADAFELWLGSVEGDGASLYRERRWAEAVRAWGLRPPTSIEERLELARSLLALGRFQAAVSALKGLTSPAARVLRLQCQLQLGRLRAARRSLGQIADLELASGELLEAAEIALRVAANQRDHDGTRHWIARVQSIRRGAAAVSARVVAAVGFWDLGDADSMARELSQAVALAGERKLPWSYHQARGLLATLRADGLQAVACLEEALRTDRRALRRYQAGRLWTDLVLARVMADDLEGAEHACRHSLRLLAGCEGPARTTLALYNLAEIRVRRGRLSGIEPIIEGSIAANRLSSNVRGLACDVELRARFELARGEVERALHCCREMLDGELEIHNRPELELLSARALGWLGRPAAAAQLLAGIPQRTLSILEPEERPAVHALAGESERALDLAGSMPSGAVWRAAIEARPISESAWSQLEPLGSYRLARLVFDVEQVFPGATSRVRRSRAARVLRAAGARSLAERLESLEGGAWAALDSFLESPSLDPGRLRRLLARIGLSDARLERRDNGSLDWEVLVEGRGGEVVSEVADRTAGWRILHAREDPAASTLLRAIVMAARASRAEPLPPRAVRRASAESGMVGSSPELRAAIERLRRLGRRHVPVVIEGETGTGKELAARLLHQSSARAEQPFLAINCAALSETLGLSDLFGHARGSFTGADRDRAGVFESARGGTVFLDEIGDLPLPAQGLLLRVLQEGEVRRLGESLPRPVDVRVVAATHRDLAERVADGAFREDLLYRLRVGTVVLPPLRARGQDLDELVDHFLESWSGVAIEPAALARLRAQPWPGNVRQLKGVVDCAAALLDPPVESVIREHHLDLPRRVADLAPYHEWLEQLKRERIGCELRSCGGNQSEAARRLGLTRQALSYLVKQLGPFDSQR